MRENESDVASDSNCLWTKIAENEQMFSNKNNGSQTDIDAIPTSHVEYHLLVIVDHAHYAIHAYNSSA